MNFDSLAGLSTSTNYLLLRALQRCRKWPAAVEELPPRTISQHTPLGTRFPLHLASRIGLSGTATLAAHSRTPPLSTGLSPIPLFQPVALGAEPQFAFVVLTAYWKTEPLAAGCWQMLLLASCMGYLFVHNRNL